MEREQLDPWERWALYQWRKRPRPYNFLQLRQLVEQTSSLHQLDPIKQRIARGADLLDIIRPGWPYEIDLERLNCRSCQDDVLGQLWGHFYDAAASIVEIYPLFRPEVFGFALLPDEEDWDYLTEAWVDHIQTRYRE